MVVLAGYFADIATAAQAVIVRGELHVGLDNGCTAIIGDPEWMERFGRYALAGYVMN